MTIATGIGTTTMGFCSCGERLGSTLNTIMKWEFIDKEQGGELLRGSIKVKRRFWYTDIMGFSLKAGQGDQTPPGGW